MTSPSRVIFSAAAALACAVLLATPGRAQNATGSIQGRVYNPATAQYVRDAEVRLDGTGRQTTTESDGTFSFAQVPAGEVSVVIVYTGYNTVRDTFTVSPGQTAVREINLTSTLGGARAGAGEVVQLGVFTVSSEREGNAKAIMSQRRDLNIITSVASDIFGDVTDGNVGEFLKYLPGVDIDYIESEARGPRLGGLDGQYNSVSFDGVRLASADAGRGGDLSRATSFESFAISSIESIEVSRTTSAESPADSPAGTINMRTRRAFDRKGRRTSFNASVNVNSEEFTLKRTYGPDDRRHFKWKPNLSLEYSDVFLNQRLGLVLAASRANSYTEQYQFIHDYHRSPTPDDPRPMVLTRVQFKDSPKFILKDTYSATLDFKASPRLVLSSTVIYNHADGAFWNRNFNFQAATNNTAATTGRQTVLGDGLTEIRTNGLASNTARNIANANSGAAKITDTVTLAQKFELKLGRVVTEGAASYSRSHNDYEGFERGFSIGDNLNPVAGDFVATRRDSQSHEWTIRQTSGADWFDLANYLNPRAQNEGRIADVEIYNADLNARWQTPLERFPTTIKFGGRWNEENRKNINETPLRIWSYIGPGGNTLTGFAPGTGVPQIIGNGSWVRYPSPHLFDTGTTNALTLYNRDGVRGVPLRASRNDIAGLFREHPEQFVNIATPANYYTAKVANVRNARQTVSAAFAQADVRLRAKLQVRLGLRVENTENRFLEFDPRTRDELLATGQPVNAAGRGTTVPALDYQFFSKPRIARTSEYRNYFPSLLLKYTLRPNLHFQAGHNRAISRPPVDSLTGVWDIVDDIQRVNAPNANLRPEHSKNYQARLAYYFEPAGSLTFGLSQNDIRNLRRIFDYTAEQFGVTDPEFADFTFRSTTNSTEERRFRSMDIAYAQSLSFLPEPFRGTSVNLAYTRVYANQRRPGMAPHRFTSSIGYNYRRLGARFGAVWVDDTPISNYGRYRRHEVKLDTSLSWKLTDRLTTYVQVRNLLAAPVRWFESPVIEGQGAALYQYEKYGANWVFGLKGTFN